MARDEGGVRRTISQARSTWAEWVVAFPPMPPTRGDMNVFSLITALMAPALFAVFGMLALDHKYGLGSYGSSAHVWSAILAFWQMAACWIGLSSGWVGRRLPEVERYARAFVIGLWVLNVPLLLFGAWFFLTAGAPLLLLVPLGVVAHLCLALSVVSFFLPASKRVEP